MVISGKESAITIHWDSKSDGEMETSELKWHEKATHHSIQTQVFAWWAPI